MLQTLKTIKTYFEGRPSYVADPHTAVGLAASRIVAAQKYFAFLVFDPRADRIPLLCSPPNVYQIVLSTAHPAKFSEAVSRALADTPSFNFDRDVLPEEFRGLLEKEKRIIDVERPDIGLVKAVIEKFAQKEDHVNGNTGSV